MKPAVPRDLKGREFLFRVLFGSPKAIYQWKLLSLESLGGQTSEEPARGGLEEKALLSVLRARGAQPGI